MMILSDTFVKQCIRTFGQFLPDISHFGRDCSAHKDGLPV